MKTAEYDEISIHSEVTEASPHRLIELLLEKCLSCISGAKRAILDQDIPAKIHAINSAMEILRYLRAILDFKKNEAKELSTLLDTVYTHAQNVLVKANATNDEKYLNEAYLNINKIKEAWSMING